VLYRKSKTNKVVDDSVIFSIDLLELEDDNHESILPNQTVNNEMYYLQQ